MEANRKIGADDYKFVAARYLNKGTVKKIGICLFSVLATAFSFLVIACYIKSMTGGPWKVPLIIAGAITTVGLCAAYWAHSRRIGK